MQKNTYLTWLLAALLISGCTNDSAISSNASKSSTIPANGSESNDQTGKPLEVTAPTPDGKSVLADIYKKPIQEGTENQLSDGRYVSYWSGSQFTLNGKKYFVAFSDATPESEIEYPAPEDMVNISQATYELIGNEWKLKSVQQDVGQFGSNNKAPAVDNIQKSVALLTGNDSLILATPTVIFANAGIQIFFYEIFSFSPGDGRWKHLGHVKAGTDNTSGCSHEADSAIKTKCVKSSGSLQLAKADNSIWPDLIVVLRGNDLSEDGSVVTLTEKNSVTYHYDEKLSSYQITQ